MKLYNSPESQNNKAFRGSGEGNTDSRFETNNNTLIRNKNKNDEDK